VSAFGKWRRYRTGSYYASRLKLTTEPPQADKSAVEKRLLEFSSNVKLRVSERKNTLRRESESNVNVLDSAYENDWPTMIVQVAGGDIQTGPSNLIVLVHGLAGTAEDLSYLKRSLSRMAAEQRADSCLVHLAGKDTLFASNVY
jgi:predicted alpha/beta-fold hydrolase